MKHNLLRAVATKVRKQCEVFAFSKDAEKYDFYKAKDLSCMCAVASYTLAMALRDKGIKCEMIEGKYDDNQHCWVEAGDLIIDITGTQFNLPRVLITQEKRGYEKTKVIKNCSELNWEGQNPNPKLSKNILRNNY